MPNPDTTREWRWYRLGSRLIAQLWELRTCTRCGGEGAVLPASASRIPSRKFDELLLVGIIRWRRCGECRGEGKKWGPA